jgi:predicted dienelactone hydrolase
MRTLEILILITLATLIIGLAFRPTRRWDWLRVLAWAVLALALLQLVIDGFRWQMFPAYLLVVFSCLRTRKARSEPTRDSRRRKAVRLARGAVEMVAWAAALLLGLGNPVFQDPMPTGPYSVGAARLYFSDMSRQDSLAPNPPRPRELLVVAWYPADITPGAQPERFWPDAPVTGPVLARFLHLPAFGLLEHLRLVKSHSYRGAAMARARERYPVLIFSHGYGGTPWQNTVQMEELASHGFIIFSIGHTYENAAIPFPDGHVASANLAEMKAAIEDRSTGTIVKQRLGVWVADTRYLIDQLTEINAGRATVTAEAGKLFTDRLDLTRLGVFGMSFGGATAGEFCVQDARCKAGMNMDGKQSGTVVENPLAVPFLYFTHDGNTENDPTYASSRGDLYRVEIRHSEHSNFCDVNLTLPILRYVGILGSIDSLEIERTLNAYTLAFFQKYLEDKQSSLLEGPPQAPRYPAAVFSARKRPMAAQ